MARCRCSTPGASRMRLLPVLVTLVLLCGNALQVCANNSMESRSSNPSQHCTDLNPQNGLDVEQIMGIWYGNEVITHDGRDEGEMVYRTCVVIHLADVTNSTPLAHEQQQGSTPYFSRSGSASPGSSNYDTRFATSYGYGGATDGRGRSNSGSGYNSGAGGYYDQAYQNRPLQPQSMRYLRLIWDESDHTLEYTLRYNSTRPGFWITSSPQSGSMIQLQYVQFTGTVQVLKAINNQLVLTFCQSLPGGQLFTIVLSRVPMGLAPEEIQSIRNLLRRRSLPSSSVRMVCQNGAFRGDVSLGALLLLAILSSVVKMFH